MSALSAGSRSASIPVPSTDTATAKGSSTGTTPPTPKPMSLSPSKLGRPRALSTSTSGSSPALSSSVATMLPQPSDANRLPATEGDWDPSGPGLPSSLRPRSRSRDSRPRSKSPGGGSVISGVWKKDLGQNSRDDAAATSASWWSQHHVKGLIPRPWKDPPKRQRTVPVQQTEAWAHTRERVAQATASVLGATNVIAHETLFIGVDLLQFSPIVGLWAAGTTLLHIWDAVQLVDMNRLQCLRLTERCAEILLSVRQEVYDAGDEVGLELSVPYQKLLEAFDKVRDLLLKQVHRPWMKRYLKRDEILRMISDCDVGLTEALGRFSLSIQIRILRKVQENEAKRQEDTQRLISELIRAGAISPDYVPPPVYGANTGGKDNALQLSGIEKKEGKANIEGLSPSSLQKFPSSAAGDVLPSAQAQIASPSTFHPAELLSTLCALHNLQNSRDAARDLADLRNSMRVAMQTGNDAELCAVLQVAREEMPEALKTLQRELERIVEREGGVLTADDVAVKAEGDGKDKEKNSGLAGLLKRSKTVASKASSASGSGGSGNDGWSRDTLDREFIESGIDALRRMSVGLDTAPLPSWTITRYEVDRDKVIGIGFFSDVYRGTWCGRTVAIKVLAETTPHDLFKHEMSIWARLQHPHVLKLYGASSAAGDPPWFFVAPYEKNGNLAQYLKGVEAGWNNGGGIGARGSGSGSGLGVSGAGRPGGGSGNAVFPIQPTPGKGRTAIFPGTGESGAVPREWDLHRFMHEIAKGMEYLHANGVLHGDLKGANVLVDDKLRCVIADFGQSEMKSEACRISGKQPPHGTLRWQAPELMAGVNQLTPEIDVYAYAITCIEILSMGRPPWALMDDDAVRHFVLKDSTRPTIPESRFNTLALQELLRVCWHSDTTLRPSFEKIVLDVQLLRKIFGSVEEAAKYSPVPRLSEDIGHESRPSPDLKPEPMPVSSPLRDSAFGTPPLSSATLTDTTLPSFHTARDTSNTSTLSTISHREETVSSEIQSPEAVFYTPNDRNPTLQTFDNIVPPHALKVTAPSSRASSLFLQTPSSTSEEDPVGVQVPEDDGYASPPPEDERIAQKKNEQRYRILLTHQFHRSLTLPLWDPTPVDLGVVGYLSKPSGTFITLFDAFHPDKSSNGALKGVPSLYGYGRVTKGAQRRDERNAAQRGIDAFVGMLAFKSRGGFPVSQRVSRRYSFPLRMGHKAAYLCTETTVYDYMDNLDAPKKWFMANVDTILQTFGADHHIQKEDLFLVIGTLKTPNYALFVSHHHPDGQAHFNVFSSQRNNQPWGTFTTDNEVPNGLAGPSYNEADPASAISASKVSNSGGPWNTVLIARLRFKPDVLEPTSLL